MPLSVGGGQLPLSAFFTSSGSSGKRSTKPKVASKRKESPVRAQAGQLPRKKRKQKENVTPSGDQIIENATPNLDSPPSASKTRRRQSSNEETESGEVDALMELVDGAEASESATHSLIDLTIDGPDIIKASAPKHAHNLNTPPLTPDAQSRHRDFNSITSLPSPPLTAPDVKRGRKKRDEENDDQEDIQELSQVPATDRGTRLGTVKVQNIDKPSLGGTTSQVLSVENNVPCSLPSSQSSRDLMPPPPLPLKVFLSSSSQSTTVPMSHPALSYRLRPTSSQDWVPSSQTQELSIPRYEDIQDDQPSSTVRLGHRGRSSQVIPSSQLSERELELFHGSSARNSSSSPVLADRPGELGSVSGPMSPTKDRDTDGSITPEIVESSQSQFETEITAAWAEILATRREALRRPKENGSGLSSSPPRVVQTQDYDAESEWSPSIDEVSQSLTMDLRTSPLEAPSQLPSAGSSGSYAGSDSESYFALPSQMRRFLETFEGRDEDGNELPHDVGARPARPRSSSPRHHGEHEPHQRGRHPSLLSSETQRETWDAITASPPAIPKEDFADGESSYGSSLPSTMPTPLRNFLEMFPDTQTQDHFEVEPSQRQEDDASDL
uniref:C2H2-type domain-containing protein n=1 Tax=Ganoderma boninense TaxID=34458 RepID=A0A5K1JTP1_9APHY|nr:C2H2-type domain-containing protein [Ganoderma boninense]